MITEEKLGEMTKLYNETMSLPEPNFMRGSIVIVIPHNVELCI